MESAQPKVVLTMEHFQKYSSFDIVKFAELFYCIIDLEIHDPDYENLYQCESCDKFQCEASLTDYMKNIEHNEDKQLQNISKKNFYCTNPGCINKGVVKKFRSLNQRLKQILQDTIFECPLCRKELPFSVVKIHIGRNNCQLSSLPDSN